MLESIFSCLFVCFAKILEISVQSVKTVFMVKGQRIQAAFLGFLECVIWGLVIASIIDTLGDNYLMLFFYCLGYSTGMYIGSVLENKIALGTSSIQLMVKSDKVEKVIEYLNNSNRGFTVLDGKGSKEAMSIVMIVLPRKEVKAVISDIRKLCDKEVFVVSSEVSKFVGGYGIKK